MLCRAQQQSWYSRQKVFKEKRQFHLHPRQSTFSMPITLKYSSLAQTSLLSSLPIYPHECLCLLKFIIFIFSHRQVGVIIGNILSRVRRHLFSCSPVPSKSMPPFLTGITPTLPYSPLSYTCVLLLYPEFKEFFITQICLNDPSCLKVFENFPFFLRVKTEVHIVTCNS